MYCKAILNVFTKKKNFDDNKKNIYRIDFMCQIEILLQKSYD